ncbi:MAG TPA: sensor domain-containing diguanylate cyclase, partial [Acidimicrobiales bacterium]|nr:sensor domain-containing diguanylate cyclase [Acidimicrobiales bacterium]
SSCYTGKDTTGHGFAGTESLRAVARAVIVLPLRSGGRRRATVVLAHSKPRALVGDEIEPLELVAAQFAATLEATSYVGRLRRQAREDPLTRLGNRGAFEDAIGALALSNSHPNAALILDIDHFKTINDELGHLAGDEALRTLAARLRSEFPTLELFRFGGDEFATVIEARDVPGVEELARELCAAAREALAPYGSSVTAGIAIGTPGVDPRALFADADAALLWAKRHARGTAVAASGVSGISPPKPPVARHPLPRFSPT